MINQNELEKYAAIYSVERLKAFIYSEQDTIDDVKVRYNHNVKISQALYPELCTLEVVLRNAINSTIKSKISETWLEDEIKNNTLLKKDDYKLLMNAYEITKNTLRDGFNDISFFPEIFFSYKKYLRKKSRKKIPRIYFKAYK